PGSVQPLGLLHRRLLPRDRHHGSPDHGRAELRPRHLLWGRAGRGRDLFPVPPAAADARGTASAPPSRCEGMTAILQARGISKHYGAVVALDKIDLELHPHEIVALIGDNGAGKSTLVKILSGALAPNEGEILYAGEPVSFESPLDARSLGIETVYQDLALAPHLDVAENIYLGRELVHRLPVVSLSALNRRAMARGARERLQSLEISLPRVSGIPVARLSGGQRQAVAVARA